MPAEVERKIRATMRKAHPESKNWSEDRKWGYIAKTFMKMGYKKKGGHWVK